MDYTAAIEIVSGLFKIGEWNCDEYSNRYAILNNDIEICIFQSKTNTMVIQAMFGDPIENPSMANSDAAKLTYLLQANFIQIIHTDDVLSFDRKTRRLAVTKYMDLVDATLESISSDIESFIHNVDFWDMAIKRKRSLSGLSPLLNFSIRR